MITCPYDWLLIRATKDGSPRIKRMRRIWAARCAVSEHNVPEMDKYISEHLLRILDRCSRKVNPIDIIDDASPEQCWKIGAKPTDPHWTRIMLALASRVALTMVDDFPNYRAPAKFRQPAEAKG